MKSIISLYITVLTFLIMSCGERNTAHLAPENLDNVRNQKVIKSIINNRKGTIAMLYGNDIALQSASDSLPEPNIGAHYTLITWQQKPMPHWYGANMNGEIYSIETVKVVQRNETGLTFDYDYRNAKGQKPADWQPEKSRRISFITGQRAAVFP